MAILELKDLNVTYVGKEKNVYAVKDVSLKIKKGESVGIVGESGSGKSTLAMSILGLQNKEKTKETGEVNFQGHDLLKISNKEFNKLRWKELAVIFQNSMNSLSPIHKIGSQLEDVYVAHEPKVNKHAVKKHIFNMLTLVNLPERVYNLYPHELSGGMLQRVSIALGLIHTPSLLIMDEATTALDVITQGQILQEIKNIEKKMQMTRIMITHDISIVASSCEKVVVMYAGEIMEVGLVEDVLLNPSHPYTQGLMKSFPSLKGEKKRLSGIKGFMPDLSIKPEGCIFASRCEFAKDICFQKKPIKHEAKENHESYCHMYGSEY